MGYTNGEREIIYTREGHEIYSQDEGVANAHLIAAAAPELYEYLKEHIEFLYDMMSKAQTEEQIAQIQGEIYGAEEAIAKAEGK